MRVAVTGSHGLIGGELVAHLERGGHHVTRIIRTRAGPGEAAWDPGAGTIEAEKLEGHDAVVHLAGVGIGDHRWTDDHKRAVRESRVLGTGLLARTLAALSSPPTVLASGSAVGFYGYDRGDEVVTEATPRGRGFLAEVVDAWEQAAAPAAEAGIRVTSVRSGVVLTAKGGALKKQLLPFKLAVGGRLGTGRQWLSWIALEDEVAAIVHILETGDLAGPVNVTSPEPVTNAEFTRAVGEVMHRPTLLVVPSFALRLFRGGELVDEMVLTGQRAVPGVLRKHGYPFQHETLPAALTAALE